MKSFLLPVFASSRGQFAASKTKAFTARGVFCQSGFAVHHLQFFRHVFQSEIDDVRFGNFGL